MQIAVEGNSGGPMVLNLDAYRIGADKLWQVAGNQEAGELCHNDRLYRTRYKAHGEEIKVHFVPITAIVTMNGFS